MALSDCPRCWETPCSCGHDYGNWSDKRIQEMIDMLQSVLDKRKPEKKTENIHDILPKHTQVYKK